MTDTNAHDERAQQIHDRERHDADDLHAQSADTLRAIVAARKHVLGRAINDLRKIEDAVALLKRDADAEKHYVAALWRNLAVAEAALSIAQEEGR